MTHTKIRILSLGLLTATSLVLSGCASFGSRGGSATETAYVARDVEIWEKEGADSVCIVATSGTT